MTRLRSLVSRRPVPSEHRSNFIHLYFDIAWFGVLNGSAIAFLSVYLVRLGASGFQVGLFSASPAMVALFLALPAGQWLQKQRIEAAVFWSAVLYRIFYLVWIPLPLLLAPHVQSWVIIAVTLVMSVPGTALMVGFNALYAEAVPPNWRGQVAGIRNALLALGSMITTLLCGQLLDHLPYPSGYQVVFGIGFLGAFMSTVHLWFVRPRRSGTNLKQFQAPAGPKRSIGDLAQPGSIRSMGSAMRPGAGLRFLARRPHWRLPSTQILRGPFGRVWLALLAFHLTQYLAIPLFPIYWVEQIHLSDAQISWGNALWYIMFFAGSTQIPRLSHRFGHFRLVVAGAAGISLYPLLNGLSTGFDLFLVAAVAGGITSALVIGSLSNHLLEIIPPDQRPAYLGWYNLALNAAILVGSLLGPVFARQVGISLALGLTAILRLLSALALFRFGRGGDVLDDALTSPAG